jgi:hypothetical protein
MKFVLIVVLAGWMVDGVGELPPVSHGCNTRELSHLIRLEIPDDEIKKLCDM